jgi:uncharacterized protein (TIGR01777 family)
MKIALTGASGFIGRRLISRLVLDGHSVHALGRRRPSGSPAISFSVWDAREGGAVPAEALRDAKAIVHLAGEPVAQRWNTDVKTRIMESRVQGTKAIVDAVAASRDRPETLVCASAIGFYGDRGEEILDEASSPGTGFLPEVCLAWEREARAAGNLGLRVVMVRIGIVLGKEGGALKKMLPPFRMGIGGPIASGQQWMSWIHVEDLVEIILFALGREQVFGPVNATAPNPVRNKEFSKALGVALGRPAILPTPAFALKMMLGEAASVVVASQRVVPAVLERTGFTFRYSEVADALRNAV